jgi:hypothetical protein
LQKQSNSKAKAKGKGGAVIEEATPTEQAQEKTEARVN